jgi:hypothetical protein
MMSSGRSCPVLQSQPQTSDAGSIETPPSSRRTQQLWKIFNANRRPEPQNFLTGIVPGIYEADATARYELEEKDNKHISPNSSVSSVSLPRKIIYWRDGDLENPYNWSTVCH